MRANKNGVNKDQKDKVKKDGYNRGQHCVYCLTYHMIFVTHYRVQNHMINPPFLYVVKVDPSRFHHSLFYRCIRIQS